MAKINNILFGNFLGVKAYNYNICEKIYAIKI